MRTTNVLSALTILTIFVSGCSTFPNTQDALTDASSSSSESLLTNNVTYTGYIAEKQKSQSVGTHALVRNSSLLTYVVSNDTQLDLDSYLGKEVEARGSAEPAGSAGETLLHVQEIVVIESDISDSSSSETVTSATSSVNSQMCGGFAGHPCSEGFVCTDDLSDDCDPKNGGADCSGVCVPSTLELSSSSQQTTSSSQSFVSLTSSSTQSKSSSVSSMSASSSVSSVASSATSASSASQTTVSKEAEVFMAKQNYTTTTLWTQKYCTTHIAYCISAHKNWYFKSFGATTSSLWHVEFGMSEIDKLGDGVIVMKLLPGSSASSGGASGTTQRSAGEVIGFKDWTDKHFEVSAPESLQSAVAYMIDSIVPYNPGE